MLTTSRGFAAAVLLCSFSVNTFAVDGAGKALEYTKLQRPSDAIGSLGKDMFGEQTDFYTGSTSFSITDISIPGNSALSVNLTRSLAITEDDGFKPVTQILGNWEIEVPHISGTFASNLGWVISSSSPNSRCSSTAGDVLKAAPPKAYVNSIPFLALEYWHGYNMHIPGTGSQELLVNHGRTQQPTDGRTYPWTTKGNWRISCLPTISGGNGEGFLAIAPDGTKYYFDRMVVVTSTMRNSRLTKPAEFLTAEANSQKCKDADTIFFPPPEQDGGGGGGGRCIGSTYVTNYISKVALSRSRIDLLATRVEDRFGNWMSYTYNTSGKLTAIQGNTVSGNDLRQINLIYNAAGQLFTATTSGRTWTYAYITNQIAPNVTESLLSTVTQPDNKQWNYQYQGSLNYSAQSTNEGFNNACGGDLSSAVGAANYLVTATHPSGAKGEFFFEPVINEISNVPFNCDISTNNEIPLEEASLWYPRQFASFGIMSKQITGPGLPTSNWTYNYVPAWGGFAASGFLDVDDCGKHACDLSKRVEVIGPDNTINRYQFGIDYQKTEGQLQKLEVIKNGVVMRAELYSYITDSQIASQAFDGMAGISPQPRANIFLSNMQRPQVRHIVQQQGVAFKSNTDSFDAYVSPTRETSESSLGYSRTLVHTYENNTGKWIVGLQKKSTEINTGLVVGERTYDANTSSVLLQKQFGQITATYNWNADGTLANLKDGKDNTTSFSNFYRGIPQRITYADASFETGIVNYHGWVTSMTDTLNSTTGFAYDAMGRVITITPPTGDSVAWAGTNQSFDKLTVATYALPAGAWKLTTSKGNYRKEIYMDSMWRPVVTREYDASNIAGTQRFTRQSYDAEGRVVFASYPGISDSLTQGTRTFYDGLGRVIKVEQDSELGILATTTQYLLGSKIVVTDPKGNQTTSSFQLFDSPESSTPVQIKSPEGITTTIVRDVFGKPLSVTRHGIQN